MKNSLKSTLAVAILAAAFAPSSSRASSATYDPPSKTLVESGRYVLSVTSPNLSPGGLTDLGAGINVPVRIQSTDKPADVDTTTALGMVSLSPASLFFDAKNQTMTTTVTVTIPTGAVTGDYTFSLSANPTQTVKSWGNSSCTLNIVISAPTAVDTTPPIVTIDAPTSNQSITFCSGGTPIDIAFSALEGGEAGSTISAVAATVNGSEVGPLSITGLGTTDVSATGSASVNFIGSYAVTAYATSPGGTGDQSEDITVDYASSWLPPLSLGKTAKGGSTVPVKFSIRDCNGVFVRDESVSVVIYEVLASGIVSRLDGVYGADSTSVRIDDTAEQYIINFKTAPGAHKYRADVYFQGFKDGDAEGWHASASKQFSVQ